MRYNRSSFDIDEHSPVSEMAVVDTFTRLIFGDQDDFNATEEMIIQAFRSVDANVLMDTHAEMGLYLRSLGVREMIHLVSRIREQLAAESEVAMQDLAETGRGIGALPKR